MASEIWEIFYFWNCTSTPIFATTLIQVSSRFVTTLIQVSSRFATTLIQVSRFATTLIQVSPRFAITLILRYLDKRCGKSWSYSDKRCVKSSQINWRSGFGRDTWISVSFFSSKHLNKRQFVMTFGIWSAHFLCYLGTYIKGETHQISKLTKSP